jgi:hypothetical protein
MSAIAVAKPRSAVFRLEADASALILTLAVVVGLTIVAWGTWGDIGRDTGYDFVAATRVAHGQLPYVDYVYYYGPLAPFLLGFVALLGGGSILTFTIAGLLVTYAIIAVTYALARTQTGPAGAAIAAAATAAIAFSPTNLSYVVPHTYSESLAILLALLFLLALSKAATRPGAVPLAGVAAGLVALTRPEFELAVIAAGVVWLVARARTGNGSRREVVALVAPAAFVPALVYGAFLAFISPHRLFFENLYPVDTLRAGGSAILRSQAPLTVHSLALVAGYFVLYAAGTLALLVSGQLLRRLPAAAAISLIGAVTVLLLAVAAVRPEAVRSRLEWVFGGLPLAAILAALFLVGRHVVRRRPMGAREATFLATVVLLAVVAAKTYDGFFFLADRAQPAVYLAPFVFVALVRLHLVDLRVSRMTALTGGAWLAVVACVCLGLTIKDARAQSATVTGPGGTLRVSPAEAPLYRAAVGAIDAGSRPGQAVLIAPQLSALYALTGRKDPLPEISLVPGALASPGAERNAIATLQRDDVRLALIDRHTFPEYGQTSFGRSFDRGLAAWISAHFRHVTTLRPLAGVSHTIDVWVRRAS